jgi:hypothetical protein
MREPARAQRVIVIGIGIVCNIAGHVLRKRFREAY